MTDAFPSNYIEAAELDGKERTLTIESVEDQHNGSGKDGKAFVKPLLRFKGARKGLVLNKTNAKAIHDGLGHGNEMQSWVGKRITIYPATTSLGKERNVPCIRVRAVPAGVSAEAPSID